MVWAIMGTDKVFCYLFFLTKHSAHRVKMFRQKLHELCFLSPKTFTPKIFCYQFVHLNDLSIVNSCHQKLNCNTL